MGTTKCRHTIQTIFKSGREPPGWFQLHNSDNGHDNGALGEQCIFDIFAFLKMTTSLPTSSFQVFDDFRRHSPENVISSCDPLGTFSAGFEVPTSYFGNLKWYIVKLEQILVCVNIFR
jgi:hypothetical protein